VEDERALTWRKSTYSGNNGGQCIEVAGYGAVYVRDSKNPDGPVLQVTPRMWRAFIDRLKSNPREAGL
jgi:hypothetical protein